MLYDELLLLTFKSGATSSYYVPNIIRDSRHLQIFIIKDGTAKGKLMLTQM